MLSDIVIFFPDERHTNALKVLNVEKKIFATFRPNIKNLGRPVDEGRIKINFNFSSSTSACRNGCEFYAMESAHGKKEWLARVIILRLSTL